MILISAVSFLSPAQAQRRAFDFWVLVVPKAGWQVWRIGWQIFSQRLLWWMLFYSSSCVLAFIWWVCGCKDFWLR
jgi:hypothetical protein